MDLSFPVSRQSDLRGFLVDTLALAERHGSDSDEKQASAAKPRTPQMNRRRWAVCNLCLNDGPTAAEGLDDQPLTAINNDQEEWTDDDNDDDENLSSMSVYDGSNCAMRPTVVQRTSGCVATETRSYFRPGCRTVSRLPAPMPIIREDDQASSADDEESVVGDILIPRRRSPPPTEPPRSQRSPQKSTYGQGTHRIHTTLMSAVDAELARCSRCRIETTTNHDRQTVTPTSTSPSLLDTMHKKYCASQYARRQVSAAPGCHGNTHLLDVATRRSETSQKDARPSADHGCAAVNDLVARQTDVTESVTGNHVTSSVHDICDAASDTAVGNVDTNDAKACFYTTSSVDVISSTLSSTGFDDEEEDDEDDEEDSGESKDEEQRSKIATVHDDQPWKKRFCDYCHGELKVKLSHQTYIHFFCL